MNQYQGMGLAITIDRSSHHIRGIVSMRRRKHDSTALVLDLVRNLHERDVMRDGVAQLSTVPSDIPLSVVNEATGKRGEQMARTARLPLKRGQEKR